MNTKLAIRIRGKTPATTPGATTAPGGAHYTKYLPNDTKRLVRRSLRTAERAIARFLRDSVLFEAGAMNDIRRKC